MQGPAPYVAGKHIPLCSSMSLSLQALRMALKIPTFILLLGHVKVETLLILCHFLVIFWLPSLLPFNSHPHFWYMKGVQVVHVSPKFHLRPTLSSQVFKFRMFSQHHKVQFQAASGGFVEGNPPNCGQITYILIQCTTH